MRIGDGPQRRATPIDPAYQRSACGDPGPMAPMTYLEGHHVRETHEMLECGLLAGSQALYGDETLRQAVQHPDEFVALLNAGSEKGGRRARQTLLIGSAEMRRVCIEAKSTDDCVGVSTDDTTTAESFKRELRWNRAHYRLAQDLAR